MSSVACLDIAREQHRRAAGLPRSANPWLFLSCLAICVVLITCITAANAPPRRIPQWFLPQPGQPGLRMPVVNQVVELTRPWAPTAMLSAIFLSQIYLLMRMMYTAARRPNLGITAPWRCYGFCRWRPTGFTTVWSRRTNLARSTISA